MAEPTNSPILDDAEARRIMLSTEEHYTLNLGPTHPATHGVFQNVLKMDGERILDAEPTIGYIHRAFEKLAEHRPFYQITPIIWAGI